MKKVFLSFVAALLCSIVSFAQSQTPTEIRTAEDFINLVGTDGSYKLMADINLGTYDATSNNFVKTSFSGTFDGNNHTITYQGSFTTNGEGDKIRFV